jgi:FkbM family methyltransferase
MGKRLQMAQASIGGLTIGGVTAGHERYLDALGRGRKEPYTAELFARSVRSGGTVVDGGAYLGFYTLVAARRVGGEGTVIAFEPNPDTFEILSRNVRANGFERRVVPLCLGLGRTASRRRFYLGGGDESKSSLFRPERWRAVTETECTSLDDALGERAVDVVKLDLEGGEVDALRGMRRTLAKSPDPRLIVECNPSALARAGTSRRALLRELERGGFEVAAIDDADWSLLPVDAADIRSDGHVNLYCRRDT